MIKKACILLLLCLSVANAKDDYSTCALHCQQVMAPLQDPDFSEYKPAMYNSSFCKLRNASNKIFVGYLKKILKNEKIGNPNQNLLDFFPSLDARLSAATERHLDLEIQVKEYFDERQSGWKTMDSTIAVSAFVKSGWISDGNPQSIRYHHEIKWDDSLRIFFLTENEAGMSLTGFSKSLDADNSAETRLCIECINLKNGIDEKKCESYNPFVYSESVLYEGNHSVDIRIIKKEGPPNIFVYGKVDSVTLNPLTLTDREKSLFSAYLETSSPKLKDKYASLIDRLKKYEVVYSVDVFAFFDSSSKKWIFKSNKEKFYFQQYEGWSVDENSFLLIQNEIDSLNQGNFIFSGHKDKSGKKRLDYLSKLISKEMLTFEHRQLWARKPNRNCYVHP